MIFELCRHILPTGHHCNAPTAGKKKHYCHFHQLQQDVAARSKRPRTAPVQLLFPEDRASIQLNYAIVQQAVAEGRLEPRQAQAIISANRAAAANLKAGPLTTSGLKDRVERVILAPDGSRIAPAREVCTPCEVLTHGPDCPCGYCAESFRGAPGELHHADCECGLCEEPPATEPTNNDVIESGENNHAIESNKNQDAILGNKNKDVAPSDNKNDVISSNENQDVIPSNKNNDVILSNEKNDVILSGVCRETANAVEEPALSLTQPPLPTDHPKIPVNYSFERTAPATSPESIIYAHFSKSAEPATRTESIISAKNLENAATKNGDPKPASLTAELRT